MNARRLSVVRFAVCAAAAVAAQLWLQATYRTVRAPMTLAAYGLETDAQVLREWFAGLESQGTYLRLIRTEVVDLVWAVSLGATVVSLVLMVTTLGAGRRGRLTTVVRRWAPLFAIGPVFDLIENGFSLAMLTEPQTFPTWWGWAHGTAARLKFGCGAVASLLGMAVTVIVAMPVRGSSTHATTTDRIDAEALPPR